MFLPPLHEPDCLAVVGADRRQAGVAVGCTQTEHMSNVH
jgi:hypothetical protein